MTGLLLAFVAATLLASIVRDVLDDYRCREATRRSLAEKARRLKELERR